LYFASESWHNDRVQEGWRTASREQL